MPIRILIADDHPLLREGVAAVLELRDDMELVGEAVDGHDAVEKFRSLRPDVALMDIQMPGMDGIAAIAAIRAFQADARIIVLTTYKGDVQALRALKAGASGYLLKHMLRRDLLETIVAVHGGRRYIPAEIAGQIAEHTVDDALSPREIEILRLVADGNANRHVATRLGITEETVKAHMKSILAKLGARDRTHATTIALRRGFIDLPE
ncbi:MAG: response regulator [Sinimarinibacterium flocculans]|uniref:response regulator n=1 Tax=Sinimarinibacterium flocculans TaxID=985250 RepID=UPI003C663EFF